MKSFFIILFCLFISFIGFSQTYQTVQSGDWTSTSIWDKGTVPPYDGTLNNYTIIINKGHDVVLIGEFIFKNNLTLIVCGTLTISKDFGETGDLTGNGLELEVCCGATFTVEGSLRLKNVGELNINGTFIVDGIYGHQANSGNCLYSSQTCLDGDGNVISPVVMTNIGGIPPIVQFQTGQDCYTGSNPIILPISLFSFISESSPDQIKLNWTTGSEINNDYFTLERSRDLYGWDVLGFVEGAGNSSVPIDYSFTDYRPLDGLAYYRLKQTDFDGAFKYYGPIAAHYDLGMEGLEFKVMKNFSHWVIAVPQDGVYQVEVYNLEGHRLHSERVENTLSIPAPEGAVVIRVTDGFERSASQVVM